MKNPKVELKGTQLFTINSKVNDHQYDIYVRLPIGYEERVEGKTYDVVYILNGQWDFGLTLGIYGNYRHDRLLPEMILIAIGWTGQETDEEAQQFSMRDHSAYMEDGQVKGGARLFLGFLETEVIPFVENTFATNGNRCLTGSSIAAWFGLFAAFQSPQLFNKYVLSSPVTAYQKGLMFNFELLFSQQATDLSAFIYISYGELEPNQPIKEFVKIIRSRGYKSLKIIEEEIEGVGHAGNKTIGYAKGLLKAFNPDGFYTR